MEYIKISFALITVYFNPYYFPFAAFIISVELKVMKQMAHVVCLHDFLLSNSSADTKFINY